MKNLSEYLRESIEQHIEEPLVNEGKISSEEDFRAAAKKKFEAVFGDELDEDKMEETIDGLLKDNKELVKDGKWGDLMGMLDKSFTN